MKFYKILRSIDIEKSNLKLPEKFEKRFGDRLARHVTLDVPSGTKWRVEVEKSDDGIWLMGQGWAEFVESLGLGNGHFLMFEFDEQLRDVFHVVVISMSASEIKYPAPSINQDPMHVEDDDDDDYIVLLTDTDDHPPINKRDTTQICYREKGKTILNDEGQIQCVVQGRKVYPYATIEGAEQALARAKAFKVTEPVFIVTLQPSYLPPANNCQLRVPRQFIVAFFDLAFNNVILETSEARTWPVVYCVLGRNSHFRNGWKQFAEDNCLTTGDVCLFALNRKTQAPNALKVAIFRTTGDDEVPISHSHP